jgi:MFS transporter, MHS family, proline/betaine transporter
MQGFSWGGEITGGTSFILESAPPKSRGRWVGFIYFCSNIPNSFVAFMLIGFQLWVSKEAYTDWAWRIPFLLGGLIGIVGYWMRRDLDESEEYKQASPTTKLENPFRSVLRSGKKSMLYVAMVMPVQSVTGILLLGFMYTFLVKQVGLDSRLALLSNAVAIATYSVSLFIGGVIGDKYGRKKIMGAAAVWIIISTYFGVWLASRGTLLGAVIGQMMIAAGSGLYGGGCLLTAVEVFPTAFRASGHAMAYQLVVAIFGGFSPLASQWLVTALQSPLAPGVYVTIVAVINLILLRFVPETRDVDLRTSVLDPRVSAQSRSREIDFGL